MWMMGYNEGGEVYLPTTNNDSFSGSNRKLRPLIPRPPPPLRHRHIPNPTSNPPNTHHHHHHHHQGRGVHNADHFLALNHHLATMAEQSKREFNVVAQQVVVSSRWNPTPEQLRTLEELWRRGTRTPSADEIQQITSRLRRYGKIEGKNVFYWFQNHKARERQKRRRQTESSGSCPEEDHDHLNDHYETGKLGNKEAGGSYKTASEDVRRSNNDTPNINNNNNNNWESAIEKGGKLAGGSASASSSSATSSSVVTSPWMKKLNDNNSTRELLLHSPNSNIFSISCCCCCDDDDNVNVNVPLDRRNAAWHDLTITPPSSFSYCRPLPTSAGSLIVTVPPETVSRSFSAASSSPLLSQDFQTLQLFPLRSCCDGEEDYVKGFGGRRDDDDDDNVGTGFEYASNCHVDHHQQFFEFLPLKN